MIPQKINAGDTLVFSIVPYTDAQGRLISAPDWSLSLAIRGNTNVLNANADGAWAFNIAAVDTNVLKAGKSFYQIYATNSATSERVTVDQGEIEIVQNFVLADNTFDPRSQTRKDLETVQTAIRNIISGGAIAEYQIGNRKARKYDLAELRAEESKLLVRLAREERAERVAKGRGNPHATFVRFK